jgi:hypothetical protein
MSPLHDKFFSFYIQDQYDWGPTEINIINCAIFKTKK